MSTESNDLQRDDQMAIPADESKRESGMPGGGQGRRDEPGLSGVYPVSEMGRASGDAPLVGEMEWGQGERGAEGYYDAGRSEITAVDGTLLPGDAGVSGNLADLSSDAGPSTSTIGEPASDPSDAATDPLSGLV